MDNVIPRPPKRNFNTFVVAGWVAILLPLLSFLVTTNSDQIVFLIFIISGIGILLNAIGLLHLLRHRERGIWLAALAVALAPLILTGVIFSLSHLLSQTPPVVGAGYNIDIRFALLQAARYSLFFYNVIIVVLALVTTHQWWRAKKLQEDTSRAKFVFFFFIFLFVAAAAVFAVSSKTVETSQRQSSLSEPCPVNSDIMITVKNNITYLQFTNELARLSIFPSAESSVISPPITIAWKDTVPNQKEKNDTIATLTKEPIMSSCKNDEPANTITCSFKPNILAGDGILVMKNYKNLKPIYKPSTVELYPDASSYQPWFNALKKSPLFTNVTPANDIACPFYIE